MAGVIGNIGHFDENVEQWSSYTERFEYFLQANAIEGEKIVPTFLSVMGAKTFTLLRSLVQPAKPGEKTYAEIVAVLSAHFSPKPLVIAERFRFHKRNQEEGETVTMFVAALKKLSEHCEFGDVLNDTIRDRLVCGLRSEAIQKRLLSESNLTLQKATEISVSMELAAKEAQQFSNSDKVHKLSADMNTFQNSPGKAPKNATCYRCGKVGHLASECWCKELVCRSCGKKGHIERVCRGKQKTAKQKFNKMPGTSKKKKNVYTVQSSCKEYTDDTDSSLEEVPLKILAMEGDSKGYWVTPIIEGEPVRMEIDTGAAVSIVSDAVYHKTLKHVCLKPTNIVLKTYTGEPVAIRGVMDVEVELNGQSATLPLYVVKGDYPTLLGRGWLETMKLDWPMVQMVSKGNTELSTVLGKHASVFRDELGTMKDITAKLDIKPDSKPKCCKARSVPYAIRSKVEKALEELVTSGVIVPVNSSDWATPIVPVLKKDGSIRICGRGKRFSKLDLSQAYLQMKVDESSKELLTIVTHKGLFRYQRLPFGITSAPSLFQRAMDQVLSGLSGVQCYLDDILVTGRTEAEHLSNLDSTLQRLKEYGLRVRKDKCEFFKQSVEYLGHVIDADGLHKAPSKVRAVLEAPAPQNVSQLRSFIGLLNYYGRFINGLATLLKPLHQLLCSNQAWEWTQQCETTFQEAKKALVKSGVLTHFNPKLPLQLACDASPYGVGAVISHIMPSRTLNKAESKYAQIEREALGIIFGIRKFHQYLYGRQFILLTDHRPLTTILGPHTGIPSLAASRMQRWALLLSAHTYEIRYRKAELHGNADGLSRLPLPVTCPESKQKDIFYFEQVTMAPVTSTQVRRCTRNDPILSAVLEMVKDGHVPKDTTNMKPYLSRKNELSVHSGCLLWGQRVIIPPSLRKPVLQQLHVGHCGIVRMKEMARSYFWWPGLEGDIEGKAKSCPSCQQVRNEPQLAPLHPWDWPETPWQRVHVDFAGPVEGKMLLIVVDAHSKWPEVAVMHSTTAEKTVVKLGEMFSRFGYPTKVGTSDSDSSDRPSVIHCTNI
ncbi:uncharacterized protein K02A2.6-like [Megalobrama amblycephala]|uniref:uncharacterized protein K02A2.6-like n=1 Tax=Megalobrama amblycephala TaxID=75352 RepID=UPI0020143A46|nr:uncharacterized protein K02A2.6-like [Megalobrama amblycephala]